MGKIFFGHMKTIFHTKKILNKKMKKNPIRNTQKQSKTLISGMNFLIFQEEFAGFEWESCDGFKESRYF
jgi:hypothetical protein